MGVHCTLICPHMRGRGRGSSYVAISCVDWRQWASAIWIYFLFLRWTGFVAVWMVPLGWYVEVHFIQPCMANHKLLAVIVISCRFI